MMKITVFQTILALLLLCQTSLLFGEDLSTHSAYKVTSYHLGAITDYQKNGASVAAWDFTPLFITNSTSDILNSEHQKSVSFGGVVPGSQSHLSSVALSAQFDATEKISFQGAFGVTRNLWTPDLFDSMNGSSWEANLGVVYKLLNNISYELHFGYMDTGDLFNNQSSYSDVESIIMISNQLTLSF